MIIWQATELSIVDPETGAYIEDVGAGIGFERYFDLSRAQPGDEEEDVTITTVVATLFRYLRPDELTSSTQARKEQVGAGPINTELVSAAAVRVDFPELDAPEFYQLKLTITDNTGADWVRTREYRVPA